MPKIFHGLGLNGPHQLVRVGATNLYDGGSFNPLAACIFAPLAASGSVLQIRSNAPVELRWVPLAHLVALPLGTGLLDGQPIKVGNCREYRLRVESRTPGVWVNTRVQLERASLLPHTASLLGIESEAQVGESRWYEFVSLDSRFWRVVAPCSAIFFAYFAPSSQLAMIHLQGGFQRLLEQLKRSGKARRDKETGICRLELDSNWHTSDIPVIARSAFDQTGFAREAAKVIEVHSEIQKREGKLVQISAVPPFLGSTQLRVVACEHVIPTTNQRVLVILQVLECSAEFPYSRLEATLDQPGPSSGNEPGPQTPRGPRKFANPFDFDFIELDGEGSRPGTDFAPITVNGGRGLRYSALTPENYVVTRREVNRTGKSAGKKTGQDPRNSSQRKSSQGDGDSRQGDINTCGATRDHGDTGGVVSKRLSPADALRYTTTELSKVASNPHASIDALLIAPKGLQYGPWTLNRVNDDVGRPKRWTTVLNGTRPRGILIANVVFHQRHAYVVEIVRRVDESFSTLIVHQPNFAALAPVELLRIFNLIDDTQRLPKNEVLTAGSDLRIHRVTHYRASGSNSLSGVLRELLKSHE